MTSGGYYSRNSHAAPVVGQYDLESLEAVAVDDRSGVVGVLEGLVLLPQEYEGHLLGGVYDVLLAYN